MQYTDSYYYNLRCFLYPLVVVTGVSCLSATLVVTGVSCLNHCPHGEFFGLTCYEITEHSCLLLNATYHILPEPLVG